jgi:hypothetical protein
VSPQEIVYTLRGPLAAGSYHLEATGFSTTPTHTMHGDLIYRPVGAADQLLASADSLTMPDPSGIPAGNIVADLAVPSVAAACGDLLVVKVTVTSGPDVPDFEVTLTLP